MKKILKLNLIGVMMLVFVGGVLNVANVYSYSSGIDGYSVDGCDACHTNDSRISEVTINGLPGQYEPGKKYNLTVTVTSNDVPGNEGGFDLSVTAGTLVVTDATNTQLSSGDLTHTSTGSSQRSWDFNWTAPTAGDVTFNVAGLAASGSAGANDDAGDTYSITFSIIPEFTSLTLILVLAAIATMILFITRKKFTKPK